jgi:YfiH family protein
MHIDSKRRPVSGILVSAYEGEMGMQAIGGLAYREGLVPWLVHADWERLPWLTHGWSTRLGGVSEGPWSSLNLGGSGDAEQNVRQNRQLWLQTLGMDGWTEVYMNQVHGSRVAVATGAGTLLATDGVVSNTPGLALHVLVADCLPILFLSRRCRAVGAVHAGWRGTVAQIAPQAVALMVREFGAAPEEIEACIGPGIGSCCYLVDEPVLSQVRRLPVPWVQAVKESMVAGQQYLDLPLLNRLLLQSAGLKPEHIHLSQVCTMHDADRFYSYRRDRGTTGRQVATIGLKPLLRQDL